MGIGDVTEPLPQACIEAMHKAVDDMARRESFHGYGPEQGYEWLREAIATNDFHSRGCEISADEIFVSDGSKCDVGNILDIFGSDNTIAVTDPVYPVYVDTNVMAGHTGAADESGEYSGLIYLRATAENNFTPELPHQSVDIIYLCSPNNPTGTVISKQRLKQWVDYALVNRAIIFFDAAYEAYITDPAIPHSIYEIPGRGNARLSFAHFPRRPALPGRAAPTPWFPPPSRVARERERKQNSTSSGTGGRARSSTVSRTSSSAAPRRFTPTPARGRCASSSLFTSRTRSSSAKV